MDFLHLTAWSFTFWKEIVFLNFQHLRCPRCWAGGGCNSMARLSGRCTEPCEYCDWLSSTDKVAYGTTSAQQSFSWTYGWQLADSMFFPINPRSGCFGSHAPGTVCGGGQLWEARACRDQPSSGRGGRRHWKEREWWVNAQQRNSCMSRVCQTQNRLPHDTAHSSSSMQPFPRLNPLTSSFVHSLLTVT